MLEPTAGVLIKKVLEYALRQTSSSPEKKALAQCIEQAAQSVIETTSFSRDEQVHYQGIIEKYLDEVGLVNLESLYSQNDAEDILNDLARLDIDIDSLPPGFALLVQDAIEVLPQNIIEHARRAGSPLHNYVVIEGLEELLRQATANTLTGPRHQKDTLPALTKHFVGRESTLKALHDELAKKSGTQTLVQTVQGMGGVGKTQIAVKFAETYGQEYTDICWINAGDRISLATDYVRAGIDRNFPGLDCDSEEEKTRLIQNYFGSPAAGSRFLLIFDNADDGNTTGLIRDTYIPRLDYCDVLITTRNKHLAGAGQQHNVDLFLPEESLQFLQERTGKVTSDEDVAKLAEALQHLPLALEQAAAYIARSTGMTILKYMARLEQDPAKLLGEDRPVMEGKYDAVVGTTWLITVEALREMNPDTEQLLQLLSFLNPNHLPIDVIGQAYRTEEVEEALDLLVQYSLVASSLDQETKSLRFDTHRLVQWASRKNTSIDKCHEALSAVVTMLADSYPKAYGEHNRWYEASYLLPHGLTVLDYAHEFGLPPTEQMALLCSKLGAYLDTQGLYDEAEQLFQQALEISKTRLGDDHPDTATSLNNLAFLYRSQGLYDKAEQLFQQALAIRKVQLGNDHPSTATSLNNLAALYESQGRYAEAEQLYLQALAIRKVQLGDDHPSTATSLNNLALLHQSQGRYAEAEPLFQQALAICKARLGDDHPSTATSLNNLALLYESQGRYDEAEQLYQQALEISKTRLGDDHPDTATCLNNLAGVYRAQGRYDEAEQLYQQALEIRQIRLGDDHPDTATCLNNLAGVYRAQGRYDEAEPLYQQALAICKARLGDDHPNTIIVKENLEFLNVMRTSC